MLTDAPTHTENSHTANSGSGFAGFCTTEHLAGLLAAAVLLSAAPAAGDLVVIAKTGDPTPGSGQFDRFPEGSLHLSPFAPAIDDDGDVVFPASINGNDFNTLFQTSGGLVETLSVDPRGWSYSGIDATVVYTGSELVRVTASSVSPDVLIAVPDVAPGTNAEFARAHRPVINKQGQVAFEADLEFGDADSGLFFAGPTVEPIAIAGATAPDSGGQFDSFAPLGRPAYEVNEDGEVVFPAVLSGAGIDSSNNQAIYRYDGDALDLIAQTGQAVPGKPGFHFSDLRRPSINAAGKVAFGAHLSDGATEAAGLYVHQGGSLTQLVSSGEDAPGGDGQFVSLGSVQINDADQILFSAFLDDVGIDQGMFRVSAGGAPEIQSIVRTLEAPPNGNGFFDSVGATINDAGDIVIRARLSGTGSQANDERLFVRGPEGTLRRVIREGQALLNSTVQPRPFGTSGVLFLGNSRGATGGLNEQGQVAFIFRLADGREGVAVWSPGVTNRVSNGGFENGCEGWDVSAPGQCSTIPLGGMGMTGQMTTTSPVTLSQKVETPALAYDLSFLFRFVTETGTLEVSLAGETIETLHAPEFGSMDAFESASFRLEDLSGLTDAALAFTLDGPSGSQIQLDDIAIREVPEPASLVLIGLGAGALIGRGRR